MNTTARASARWRIGWAVLTLLVVEALICSASAFPAIFMLSHLARLANTDATLRIVILAVAVLPSYGVFALCLMIVSPLILRATTWRTRPDTAMRIADMDWPLLDWGRSMAAIHVVRVFAGTLFRGSPLWTLHLRLSGARIGRGVYVNSLSVSDYNLLEFGDAVVIGADAHVSGHTVEHGIVKTAGVRLHQNVTIGIGAIVEIGVEVGPNCQVGALSFVPKYTNLRADGVYAGIPVKELTAATTISSVTSEGSSKA